MYCTIQSETAYKKGSFKEQAVLYEGSQTKGRDKDKPGAKSQGRNASTHEHHTRCLCTYYSVMFYYSDMKYLQMDFQKQNFSCVGQEDQLLKLILQGFMPTKTSPLTSHSMSLYPWKCGTGTQIHVYAFSLGIRDLEIGSLALVNFVLQGITSEHEYHSLRVWICIPCIYNSPYILQLPTEESYIFRYSIHYGGTCTNCEVTSQLVTSGTSRYNSWLNSNITGMLAMDCLSCAAHSLLM